MKEELFALRVSYAEAENKINSLQEEVAGLQNKLTAAETREKQMNDEFHQESEQMAKEVETLKAKIMAQTGPEFLEQSKGGTVRKVDENEADFDRATGEFECQVDFTEDLNTDLIQMRLMIEASEEPPQAPQGPQVPEVVKDELEGKIIKYKKKLRMEKERIQSLEDQLAISAQELDQFRQ